MTPCFLARRTPIAGRSRKLLNTQRHHQCFFHQALSDTQFPRLPLPGMDCAGETAPVPIVSPSAPVKICSRNPFSGSVKTCLIRCHTLYFTAEYKL